MRSTSLEFIQSVFAQETGEGYIPLVTIDHPSLNPPIRAAGWDVNVVSRGNTFAAFPFRLQLPTDVSGAAPRARLTIDNVDRKVVQAVRNAGSVAPTVTIEVVRFKDPDVVELSMPGFSLRNVSYNALTVEGELSLDTLAAETYPSGRFRPAAFPGLF